MRAPSSFGEWQQLWATLDLMEELGPQLVDIVYERQLYTLWYMATWRWQWLEATGQ